MCKSAKKGRGYPLKLTPVLISRVFFLVPVLVLIPQFVMMALFFFLSGFQIYYRDTAVAQGKISMKQITLQHPLQVRML